MKVSFFDAHDFEKKVFDKINENYGLEIHYLPIRLDKQTAKLAEDSQVVCSFVNDKVDKECIDALDKMGVKLIASRSAGFNHIDLKKASEKQIKVIRVPSYSPHAVAEYTIALLLNMNRKIHKSYARVRELNFSLDGLIGFDLNQRNVGIIGTGKIGTIVAKILSAFGCKVLCYDKNKNEDLEKLENIQYVEFDELCEKSDIISLHIPLTPDTHYILNEKTLKKMKRGVYIINTGRGALIDSKALISSLKSGHIGAAALDVYEEEENVFFQNISDQVLQDDTLARLLTFPNVIVTSHQAFLTKEALENIAVATLKNIYDFLKGNELDKKCVVHYEEHHR